MNKCPSNKWRRLPLQPHVGQQPIETTAESFYVVPINKSNEIVEMDTKNGNISARNSQQWKWMFTISLLLPTARLLHAKDHVQTAPFPFVMLTRWKELARLPTKRKVVHEWWFTPDHLYSLVLHSRGGVRGQPGNRLSRGSEGKINVAEVDTTAAGGRN